MGDITEWRPDTTLCDLSISEYNTLRIPSAVHDYDLYADTGRFYEDVKIDGGLQVGDTLGGQDLYIPNDLDVKIMIYGS